MHTYITTWEIEYMLLEMCHKFTFLPPIGKFKQIMQNERFVFYNWLHVKRVQMPWLFGLTFGHTWIFKECFCINVVKNMGQFTYPNYCMVAIPNCLHILARDLVEVLNCRVVPMQWFTQPFHSFSKSFRWVKATKFGGKTWHCSIHPFLWRLKYEIQRIFYAHFPS